MSDEKRCRCGLILELPEEKHCNTCWCCAAYRGHDIGAKYYYDTGIWSRPKYFNKPRRKENYHGKQVS